MEYSGMASVWFGVSKSFEILEEYVDIEYTVDGDSIDSKFGINFEFGYYDEENIEICFYEKPKNNVDDILNDFSYSGLIIPKIKELINGDKLAYSINSVIVLYDYQYNKVRSGNASENIEIKFIGTVPYK
ncbi:immunity 22 family protein [Jeotgalibacillus sp. ET6]|uniref:immunity 22 family protein n=1 Tax=Jeotgalibacillus sp. ET6 TaxID=3037260 RepID=UPI0024183C7B|nr:immunity 22 family protein [Jeotgalibacillus sp. ET6]MDG5471398.1 immunity 22 family protein [Jeotgalibacillus sp. ET6]